MSLGAVILITIELAVYGIYLVLVGVRQVGIGETWLEPHPGGYIVLLGAGILIIGLVLRNITTVWIGGTVIAMFSALFMFSIGIILIPVSIVLLLLLGAITWTGKLNRG